MTKDLQFLIETVKQASELITDDFQVKAKDDKGDLVTNFDYAIEKFIIEKINESYPNFDVVSEEFNAKAKLTENCFTIDPIDGTINFAHNIPMWGIEVACIKNGKHCAAVVYLPKLNEFYCADETGAYLNGEKIQVCKSSTKNFLFSVGGKDKYKMIENLAHITRGCRLLYCACIEFVYVACGRLAGTIFRKDTHWDYIPGLYIAKQAGAYVIDEPECHIVACSKEIAEILKNSSDEINLIGKK